MSCILFSFVENLTPFAVLSLQSLKNKINDVPSFQAFFFAKSVMFFPVNIISIMPIKLKVVGLSRASLSTE